MTISNSVKLFTASIVAGTMFLGCGSDDNTTAAAPAVQTGTFVDAPVKGLKFKSATQEGITNEKGEFTYVNGEDVEFFLGTLSFGSVQGQTLVTPYTMAGVGIGEQNNKATNIALLLQNFDANQSDSTILDVSLLRDHNFSGVTLDSTPADMETTISSLFSAEGLDHFNGYTLKDATQVENSMSNYLENQGLGTIKGVRYTANLNLTAAKIVELGRNMTTYSTEYFGYYGDRVEGTNFSKNYVNFNDGVTFTEFSADGDVYEEYSLPASSFVHTALDDTRFQNVITVPGEPLWSDVCEILSVKKVDKILDVSVDAIEFKNFCVYGENSDTDWGNNERTYLPEGVTSTTELKESMITTGYWFWRLNTDNTVSVMVNEGVDLEKVPNSSWKIENDILKIKFTSEVWFKVEDNQIYYIWKGDTGFSYHGVTKDQANAINQKLGIPSQYSF